MNKKEKNTYKNTFQVYCSCPKDITLLCIALFFLVCTFLIYVERKNEEKTDEKWGKV